MPGITADRGSEQKSGGKGNNDEGGTRSEKSGASSRSSAEKSTTASSVASESTQLPAVRQRSAGFSFGKKYLGLGALLLGVAPAVAFGGYYLLSDKTATMNETTLEISAETVSSTMAMTESSTTTEAMSSSTHKTTLMTAEAMSSSMSEPASLMTPKIPEVSSTSEPPAP